MRENTSSCANCLYGDTDAGFISSATMCQRCGKFNLSEPPPLPPASWPASTPERCAVHNTQPYFPLPRHRKLGGRFGAVWSNHLFGARRLLCTTHTPPSATEATVTSYCNVTQPAVKAYITCPALETCLGEALKRDELLKHLHSFLTDQPSWNMKVLLGVS